MSVREKVGHKENVVAVLRRGNRKTVIRETWWTKLIDSVRRTLR